MAGEYAEKPREKSAAARREERQARLAQALRENLKKRKEQARGRAEKAERPREDATKDA